MSTVLPLPGRPAQTPRLRRSGSPAHHALLAALLTPISLFTLGYHPYAEDGGLYLAGVKYLLNPSLFPREREFVTAPLGYSLFAPTVAGLARHSAVSFDLVVFGLFLLSLSATIFAGALLAQQCFQSEREQLGATLVVALWLGLPVAGTSLMLVDPYLTARSFSTPLVLFSIAFTLRALAGRRNVGVDASTRRNALFAVGFLAAAAAFHPLMAGYGAAFVVAAAWMEFGFPSGSLARASLLAAAALLLAAAVQRLAPAVPPAFARVALTRGYWYLLEWRWFEIVGVVAPLLLLGHAARSASGQALGLFARTSIALGGAAIAVALCFARVGQASWGVAHLQPMRVFQTVYFLLLLSLGGFVARRLLHDVTWRWALACLLLGACLFLPSLNTFAHSPHLELSLLGERSGASENAWVDAFRWVRRNTPADALFALDARYITESDEDAQSFRAIAERSALADFSKDGGETAVNPKLAEAWVRGVDAQEQLSTRGDVSRRRVLGPLGVTWLILRSAAVSDSACPYNNGTIKVCRLL